MIENTKDTTMSNNIKRREIFCWLCGRSEDKLGYEFVELHYPSFIGEYMCDDCIENNRDNEFGTKIVNYNPYPKR